jgi:phospholipase/carboxylesterase
MEFVHKFQPGTKPLALLLLHGSGGDENDLMPVASALAPGAALLSPRGGVLQHGQRRFFAYPGPDGFDPNEIADRAAELAEWLGRMKKQYGIDCLYAFGYSNGANMAAVLMLLHPGSISGACLLRARAIVAVRPDLGGAPVLISAGQADEVIPLSGAEALAQILTDAKAHVDFVVQNAGHDLTPADFSIAKQWLGKLCGG